eukprot:g1110.t1
MKKENTVFIGNIAFNVTEAMLREIFGRVGPIVSLRIVTDRETGRPRGYAFCQYGDIGHRNAAMATLDGCELMGRRLRVNTADSDGTASSSSSTSAATGQTAQSGAGAGTGDAAANIDRTSILKAQEEEIQAVVQSLSLNEQWHLMAQLKKLVAKYPEKSRELFLRTKVLSRALLRIQENLNMQRSGLMQQQQQAQVQQAYFLQQQRLMTQNPAMLQQSQQAAVMGGNMGAGGVPNTGAMNTGSAPMGVPPPLPGMVPGQMQPAAQFAALDATQQELVRKCLRMTKVELDALAPKQRDQVNILRGQYGQIASSIL